MKFLHLLTLLLVTLVAYASAQCGGNRPPSCNGPRNVGRGGRGCIPITLWYFDGRSRQCREMRYLGCGGNNNRWCTRTACNRNCRRS